MGFRHTDLYQDIRAMCEGSAHRLSSVLYLLETKKYINGGVAKRHCNTEFMKQVLPRLHNPV